MVIVKQVIIHKLVDGIFYSSLICERDGIEEIIDARTSDAIALALRFEAPIFTYKSILDQAGVDLNLHKDALYEDDDLDDEDDEEMIDDIDDIEADDILSDMFYEHRDKEVAKADDEEVLTEDSYSGLTIGQLNDLLQAAVQDEAFEIAAQIRDEIEKRK